MPNTLPIAAVIAIAAAPQKATRNAPRSTGAPPAYAAVPPNTASATSATADVTSVIHAFGASSTVTIGTTAPAMNATADANAAWSGRARCISVMPSSSRACAASASPDISFSATCFASGASSPRAT